MSGEAWDELCDKLKQAGRLVLGDGVPATPRDRAEGYRYLTRFLASGLVSCVTHDDPDHPVFGRMMDYTRPWGLDFPDCLYLYAPIRGDARYRIWGQRGGANLIDLQVNSGHYANGDVAGLQTIASISGDALESDAAGAFELWIGGEERPGNWLPSAPKAEFVLLRQIFDDWEGETPGDFFIERENAPWPAPPPTTEWMAERLDKLGRWLERGGGLWETMSQGLLSGQPNSMVIHMPEDAGKHTGTAGQAYGMGSFACAHDEAVILELRPPTCRHWNVSLANYFWEAIEFASHQSSLNGAQASLDPDGSFRGVIAQRDPGVPNWLDPAGNTRGTLVARFIHAGAAPAVRFERVAFEKLRSALPGSTPELTPGQRAEILARRRRAVLARYRR